MASNAIREIYEVPVSTPALTCRLAVELLLPLSRLSIRQALMRMGVHLRPEPWSLQHFFPKLTLCNDFQLP